MFVGKTLLILMLLVLDVAAFYCVVEGLIRIVTPLVTKRPVAGVSGWWRLTTGLGLGAVWYLVWVGLFG